MRHRSRRRFRHPLRPRHSSRQRKGPPHNIALRVPPPPQARRPRLRHPVPCRPPHRPHRSHEARFSPQAGVNPATDIVSPSRSTPPAPASSPSTRNMQPLDDYYLWCDHRAKREAREITSARPRRSTSKPSTGAAASTRTSGASPSSSTGSATTPRPPPAVRLRLRALRHDRRHPLRHHLDPLDVKRSVCAMGHKWLWNPQKWGGFPPAVLPLQTRPPLRRHRRKTPVKTAGQYLTSDHLAGHLSDHVGRRSSASNPASPSPWEPSTPTGTPSAQAAERETSSTSSAPPPASSPCSSP